MLEITYATRKKWIILDNGATSCYDRILEKLMSIISQEFGTHKSVIVVWAKTLEEARYYLKTNTTISEEYYSHSEEYPIHGAGQGSANASHGWLFVSSKLFNCF